ncbi:hypothetical protein V3F56_07790 [Moorellaceae bacterium AZ2]
MGVYRALVIWAVGIGLRDAVPDGYYEAKPSSSVETLFLQIGLEKFKVI